MKEKIKNIIGFIIVFIIGIIIISGICYLVYCFLSSIDSPVELTKEEQELIKGKKSNAEALEEYIETMESINEVRNLVSSLDLDKIKEIREDMNVKNKELKIPENGMKECESYSDIVLKRNCFTELALLKNDSSLCDYLTKMDQGMCYSNIAWTINDPNVCIEQNDINDQITCLRVFAVTKDRPLVCSILYDLEDIKTCYIKLSEDTKNILVCDYLDDQEDYADCYANFAAFDKNPSRCERLENSPFTARDYCYFYYVLTRKDYSVCQLIEKQGTRDSCYEL